MLSYWVSHAELLEEWRISRATARRWVIKGVIPKPVKLGNKLYWDRRALEALLSSNSATDEGPSR